MKAARSLVVLLLMKVRSSSKFSVELVAMVSPLQPMICRYQVQLDVEMVLTPLQHI